MQEVCDKLFPTHEEQDWTQTETIDIEPIGIGKIEKAESKIQNKKAPGTDNIPLEVIKIITKKEPEMLKDICNKLLAEGLFPHQWKMAKIILVPKPEKNPQDEITYRPICLLNVVGKLYEHIMLEKEVENKGDKDNSASEKEDRLRMP